MPQIDELDSTSSLVLRQRSNQVVINSISSDYTLAASDWGKWIETNSSSDIVITVPPQGSVSIGIGSAIPIVRYGPGEVTIAPGSGVTINSDGEDNAIPSQFKTVLLFKRDTNEWYLQGIGAVGSSSGGGGGDVTIPTIVSATAIDANTIRVVFSESVTATTAGWSFHNGGPLTVNSVSGATTTWDFDINENMTAWDIITRTYSSGSGATIDGGGNELASFTSSTVTNSIPESGTEIEDDFNASNTTNIAGRSTPIGSLTWAKVGTGTIGISSNAAYLDTAATDPKYYVPTSSRDTNAVLVFSVVNIGSSVWALLRYADNNNMIQVNLETGLVYQTVGGVPTGGSGGVLVAANGTSVDGDIIRIHCKGANISVYRNDALLGSTTSASGSLTSVNHGFFFYQDTVSRIDNVQFNPA